MSLYSFKLICKLCKRKNQVTRASLLKITSVDTESLNDFSSKLVLFIVCPWTEFTRNSNGNDIFLGMESIFTDLK